MSRGGGAQALAELKTFVNFIRTVENNARKAKCQHMANPTRQVSTFAIGETIEITGMSVAVAIARKRYRLVLR
jgi:hypothetical protein